MIVTALDRFPGVLIWHRGWCFLLAQGYIRGALVKIFRAYASCDDVTLSQVSRVLRSIAEPSPWQIGASAREHCDPLSSAPWWWGAELEMKATEERCGDLDNAESLADSLVFGLDNESGFFVDGAKNYLNLVTFPGDPPKKRGELGGFVVKYMTPHAIFKGGGVQEWVPLSRQTRRSLVSLSVLGAVTARRHLSAEIRLLHKLAHANED